MLLFNDILTLTFALIWILGTIMTISKDRVKPSPVPDSWKLAEIFTTGIVLGAYLALMTVIFFYLAYETNFFAVISLHIFIIIQPHVIFRMQGSYYAYLSRWEKNSDMTC